MIAEFRAYIATRIEPTMVEALDAVAARRRQTRSEFLRFAISAAVQEASQDFGQGPMPRPTGGGSHG
jgi:metal-responsive CopG/Arc/MetJ family transcriptional regulator